MYRTPRAAWLYTRATLEIEHEVNGNLVRYICEECKAMRSILRVDQTEWGLAICSTINDSAYHSNRKYVCN